MKYILDVVTNSIADKLNIVKGYNLISINDNIITDVIDYIYYTSDEEVTLKFFDLNNSVVIFDIEKDFYEELGLIFETELMDKPKLCRNKCIFCFMDQIPTKSRDTLKLKDDDYRLSFLAGNYVTLTNLDITDIKRIIKFRLSPINISVHTTDSDLRCNMLNNKNAGKVLKYIDILNKNNIKMNFQIVLCKDINDKDNLIKTVNDLSVYYKNALSISIVPVGISKYRDGLFNLKKFNKQEYINLINDISILQNKFKNKYNTNLVYLSDEIYLKALVDIPDYSFYEDFYQIENGVGMIANFEYEFNLELENYLNKNINKKDKRYIATGNITYNYINKKIEYLNKTFGTNIKVININNNYFGTNIDVTGLICGSDLIDTIKDIDDLIILPDVCLKDEENIFLDDVKLSDINKNIKVIKTNAKDFLCEMLGEI
ncbi:MAG: DUF512 domain-containing protein [Clostridia bacterium]